ncbi:MAG TPA: NADH:ubiquinone oxidoreductase subunit NDUFA12 [Micavibrio sp.]
MMGGTAKGIAMGVFSLLGVLSPAYTTWTTLLSGAKRMGADQAGNRYYRAKARPGYKRERRWVIYQGVPEASKVPPEWHGWLHHQTDELPEDSGSSYRRSWQKPHKPNQTGSAGAYLPPGHMLARGRRDVATGDYEAWTPDQDVREQK